MSEKRVVALVTCPVDKAREIASRLVADRLVACVNIVGPVVSVYRWKGEVNTDEESLLVIKSVEARVEAIEAALREVHPYEVFEFVCLPIEAGSKPYLDWIVDESSD